MFFASLVAAIMLWKAIGGKHPYAFYTALRWVCFGVFFCSVVATFSVTREYDEIWLLPVIFGALLSALAVLFNPFLEFHFRRETWRVIDIVSLACVLLLIFAFYGRFAEELPPQIKRATKLIIWFFAAGLVAYYTADESVRLYGKYALATATTTATVFEVDEEEVDSETQWSGVRYTGVYRFQVNGKTYYGRTDHHDEVGDSLLVRYNPANPEHNRDASGDVFDEKYTVVVFGLIVFGLYWWLKWILASEKTLPCKAHPDRPTKKRFYHWVENQGFHYVVDHGPRCEECINQLHKLHRVDGCTELLYKPLPESFYSP
jgi:uncharacterized protein DUF6804/uncharacterized protein DUF3592